MRVLEEHCDIAILGSGFAGSLMAAILARQGRSVVLLERGRHPRFAIGESSTPLSNLFLEELAKRYDLPAIGKLAKWGTWQESYPHVACGLKRGFTFLHHAGGAREAESMFVAASPHDALGDTHWFRADFDYFLLQQAQSVDVAYYDDVALQGVEELEQCVVLQGNRHGAALTVRARFVVDASGPRGGLHRLLKLEEKALPEYPKTQALFSHFTDVARLDSKMEMQASYPADDAAVHHLFDGGWVWVLRFNNGVTSAGVAATETFAKELRFEEGEAAWARLLERLPVLQEQFGAAKAIREFTHMGQVSFRSAANHGKRWVMLPSAAGFVDPLLSTGFPLTLFGVSRLATVFENHWNAASLRDEFSAYGKSTEADLLQANALIGALYANLQNFAAFRAILLVYFAAVSYAESARRLGRGELASSFLLREDSRFGEESRQLLAWAHQGISPEKTEEFAARVKAAIAPLDVAGLTRTKENLDYACDAQDLIDGAWKLQVTPYEVQQMLERSGFYANSERSQA